MGFFSFLGRVLFSSLFILSAWQMFNEFGEDGGGPAAKELTSKVDVLRKLLSANIGVVIPDVDPRHLVTGIIALKGLGGSLFVFGSLFGAYVLLVQLVVTTPVLFDFYNYSQDEPQHLVLLKKFLQSVALFGALLFFIGMKNSFPKRQLKKKVPKAKQG